MCGLIAALFTTPLPETALRAGLTHMRARGPDGGGVWQDGGA